MRHSRVSTLVAVGVLLYVAGTALYFGTGYRVARAQAVSVALGAPMPGPGLADSTWGVRLGGPGVDELVVGTSGLPEPTSPTSAVFTFVLSNSADPGAPPLTVFVGVRLTLHGWRVTGDGTTS